ncbi:retrovirus-related pol polyprotein from transposon TNT 1-94 [Tanacetum coccineum]
MDAERKNRTLPLKLLNLLADSLLPIQFWAEAVNTACYVLNRVLVTKPQMKTPYEILMGRSPNISFMRPFGCSLTILNTLDQLGKFDGKSEEGYLLGYSTSSKGFRVYNRVTRKVQECLHVDFLENQENQKGKGPDWMFDLDLLTPSMNYIPVRKENYANSGDKVSTLGDVEDLDDQQFIVHTAQPMHPEERTAAKEVPLSSEEQALHDELMNLMHQESLVKAHNDDQRIAFEEEKRRTSIAKGKIKVLCDLPEGKRVIGTKWVFRNKRDERGTIIKRNKARRLHKGTDKRKVWIMMSLHQLPECEAFQSFCFLHPSWALLSIMDVKSAFLLAISQKEVYENTSRKEVKDFEELMQKEFKMSSMGELTFFLGLQVKQSNGGTSNFNQNWVYGILQDSPYSFGSFFPDMTMPVDNHDKRSTSEGMSYRWKKLVSWQCTKQTMVAKSSTRQNMLQLCKMFVLSTVDEKSIA